MKKQIYIVHGYDASPQSHWFSWFKEKMRSLTEVEILKMPNPQTPKLSEWLETMTQNVNLGENSFIIAHSLGTITSLNFLSGFANLPKFGGLVLISPFDEPIEKFAILNEFCEPQIAYEKIKSAANFIKVIAAKDDYIVPCELSLKVALNLDVTPDIFEKGGHFMSADGFSEFEFILNLFQLKDEKLS